MERKINDEFCLKCILNAAYTYLKRLGTFKLLQLNVT